MIRLERVSSPMTGRRIVALGWIAAFASASAYGSTTVPDLEKERQNVRAITFRDYVEAQHFSLRLAFDERGRVTVRKRFLGPSSQADVLCGGIPTDTGFDFLPQARFDLYFVEQCLSEEMPGLNIDTVYDAALRDVQERLDGLDLTSQYDVTQVDLIRLEPWAQGYLNRLLKKEGLPDLLVGAWRRHAFSRSKCYEAKTRELANGGNAGKSAMCDRWSTAIGTARFRGPDPSNLIFDVPAHQVPAEQRAVADLDALGLRNCLGILLARAADPSVLDAFNSFGYSLTWSAQERLNEYAREVWRPSHVDEWLERTIQEGAVPQDVKAALNDCVHAEGRGGPRVVVHPDTKRRMPPTLRPWEWEQRNPSPSETLLEDRYTKFMAYVHAYWIADVERDPAGKARVVPAVDGPHDDDELYCQPQQRKDVIDFFATARLDLPIVLQCLQADFPDFDVGALHRAATADAESELNEAFRKAVDERPPPDLLELQIDVDSRVAQALEKSGVYDFLSGAWRRYIGGESDCYETAWSRFEARRSDFLTNGGTCDAPEQLITLSPSMKPDLLNYVIIGSDPVGPTHDAIAKLQALGLSRCLGQILEQVGDRDTMGRLGMLQEYPSRFRYDRAVRYAWGLWREHGLEEWIRQVSDSGGVPRHLRTVIQKCASGKLPERVHPSAIRPASKGKSQQRSDGWREDRAKACAKSAARTTAPRTGALTLSRRRRSS
jgi:hypothetical protein